MKKKFQIATLEKHSVLFKKILKQCSKLLHLVKNIQGENSSILGLVIHFFNCFWFNASNLSSIT